MLNIFEELGAKPSKSEERGLALFADSDLVVFSPGISTAGFAEIRMVQANSKRKVIATTIDEKELDYARDVIKQVGMESQIETKLEDLRQGNYPENTFDFVYARLVLHYLSAQDLEKVLAGMHRWLKPDGRIFVVVRSVKNVDYKSSNVSFNPGNRMTTVVYKNIGGLNNTHSRYFHTPQTITNHLKSAGFIMQSVEEYQERLYKDFMRREISDHDDHVIEVVCSNKK